MKIIILMLSLFGLLVSANAKETSYKYTTKAKVAAGLLVSSTVAATTLGYTFVIALNGGNIAFFELIESVFKSPQIRKNFASVTVNGLKTIVVTGEIGGLVLGVSATIEGLKEVDQEALKTDYKKLGVIIDSSIATGITPNSINYHRVLDRFECSNCKTDQEKAQKFNHFFKKAQFKGKQLSKINDEKERERLIAGFFKKQLGNDYTTKNISLGISIIATSLVANK